jgi:hypothetical protein
MRTAYFTQPSGQLAELIEIIAAVNDARIDERRGFGWHSEKYSTLRGGVNGHLVVLGS